MASQVDKFSLLFRAACPACGHSQALPAREREKVIVAILALEEEFPSARPKQTKRKSSTISAA